MKPLRFLISARSNQIYVSRSRNPYFNLAFEDYLLRKTPAKSNVLFLYVNRPCVVIGRNQNPWNEANLQRLRDGGDPYPEEDGSPVKRQVWLARRRSGGGTVFHDEGNLNYSVICPSATFTRNKHVEMVTRALRKLKDRARVNERHDIVLDMGDPIRHADASNMFETIYSESRSDRRSFKVSGSAFKITRGRSLHHGTCLLSSPYVDQISGFLKSPARDIIKSFGTESVRSLVGNVMTPRQARSAQAKTKRLVTDIIREFSNLYRIQIQDCILPLTKILNLEETQSENREAIPHIDQTPKRSPAWVAAQVGEKEVLESLPELAEDMQVLRVGIPYHSKHLLN